MRLECWQLGNLVAESVGLAKALCARGRRERQRGYASPRRVVIGSQACEGRPALQSPPTPSRGAVEGVGQQARSGGALSESVTIMQSGGGGETGRVASGRIQSRKRLRVGEWDGHERE